MTMIHFDKHVVKAAAQGRWAQIFAVLAPQLDWAQAHPGKHGPCPVHGGTDGFRLFPDYQDRGNGICNTCGAKSDGFQMLMWLNDWTFSQTVDQVAACLGLNAEGRTTRSLLNGSHPADPPNLGVVEGIVTFMGRETLCRPNGTSATVFTLKVRDAAGRIQWCRGADLQRAALEAKVTVGQRVRIQRCGVKAVVRPNGMRVNKTLWDVVGASSKRSSSSGASSLGSLTAENAKRRQAIRHLWQAGRPISQASEGEGTALERYLNRRGIDLRQFPERFAESLRFIPSAFYHNDATGVTESYPAMLTAVRDLEGRLVTVHRTFLTDEGRKAPIATPKRLMALSDGTTINGTAIRFGMPDDVLCIAEGVETALSVLLGTGYPCWAAVSAIGMTEVQIPQGVRTVFIFADKDRTQTGAKAAVTLRARLADEGRLAVIIEIADDIPEGSKGLDWNDILQTRGCGAFPLRKPTV